MAKGFKDDEGNFRPTGQPVGTSKKKKSIDISRGTLITEPTLEFIPRESGVSWETAVERFVEYRDDNSNLDGFSFEPDIDNGFDFNDADQVIDFHELFVEGGEENPVFVIAVTNQLGGTPTRELQSAFEQTKNEGKTALIGFFRDDLANEFTDISFPISGIDREEALELAENNAQDSIAVLFNDGTFSIENVR